MQTSVLQLVDVLTDDLRFAGVPEHALNSLRALKLELAVEDASSFNVATRRVAICVE